MTIAQALTAIHEADLALAELGPLPFPLPIGRLGPLVAGAVSALGRGDWWVPSLRERVGAVVRGVPVERLRDGFAGARPFRVAPPGGSPALRALTAVGLAKADPDSVAVVHLGIGSAADGAFYEALNLAALLRARVVFLVAVDPLGGDAPLGRQLAASIEAVASAFGLPTTTVDGNDANAVHRAVQHAISTARSADGPRIIVAGLARRQEGST